MRYLLALAGLLVAGSSVNAAGISKGPYLQLPGTDGITVCWVTDAEVLGEVTCSGKTVRDEKPSIYHKVRVKGLKPYTNYSYSVSCDGDKKTGTFRTAAPVKQPFQFAIYGDNRTQPQVHTEVLARMLESKPDFIVQTGDLVADGTQENLWTEFFQVAGKTLASVPYYPALGNHERDGAAYLRYFAVPREYSFDYGDVHFVCLDSNRRDDEFAAQQEWLRKDLAAHQSAAFRVVFFHHTVYTCVTKPGRRELAEKLRARLEPIFLEGNVQLVLNGHDHDYQHHVAKGIHYVVTGGGGAPLYDVLADTPFVKAAKKTHHFCEAKVSGNVISIRALERDGAVIESFTVSAKLAAKP